MRTLYELFLDMKLNGSCCQAVVQAWGPGLEQSYCLFIFYARSKLRTSAFLHLENFLLVHPRLLN